ncbi:hypothetical protein AA0311_1313 [Asaia bogorensis NBRC 16594]|uniref:Uncharacterized protein n=1 Tax=Asaia bogorensis NBRC 16594 TaxID=1231624 RepID=A0AAN4U4D4_9PROT|nr:hypothetical protein AA0311_1313 [Asaia bogorensis NBRC 16594]GEL54760.1 hypothetical protein ABO01nite_27670 [Asaia bogorensis NBRC 16594]
MTRVNPSRARARRRMGGLAMEKDMGQGSGGWDKGCELNVSRAARILLFDLLQVKGAVLG